MPKRGASAHALDLCFAKRDGVLADFYAPLRSLYLSRRKKRKIVVLIARQKIIDIVFSRVHASHERGPGYRRDGWKCGAQLAESSLLLQLREIWQHAFGDEAFGEFGVHTVESQNHRSLDLGFTRGLSATEQPQQMA